MDTDYLKRVGLYIAGALFSLGLIFYVGFHIWHTFTREVTLETMLQTTVEHTLEAEGYLFRNERPLSLSTSGGTLVPTVKDGEKLAVGGEAAKVYSDGQGDVTVRIDEIDRQIALLQDCTDRESLSLKDAPALDADIYSILTEMRTSTADGQIGDAINRRADFFTAINKRMILSGTIADFGKEIAALQAERNALIASLGACRETVRAPVSGYYYSACDGFEESFTADFLEDDALTYEALSERLAMPAGSVGNGGKLATNSLWYLVCVLDRSQKALYRSGDTCTVCFGTGETTVLTMDVDRILEGKDSIALILSTRTMPKSFAYSRMQTVRLVTRTYTGFRVPISAVRMVDGVSGVYVLDGSTVRFRQIYPILTEDGYYISASDPYAAIEEKQKEAARAKGEPEPQFPDRTETERKTSPEGNLWLAQHESLIIEGRALYDGKVLGG